MTPNVGTIDRIARLILGVVLIALPLMSNIALFQSTAATTIAIIAGIVMLATSGMRFCPIYRIFGMRTCKV